MKDVRDWDETDLDLIVKAGQKETTTLDYKDSEALNFRDKKQRSDGKGTLGDKHRQDLIRDVASMANAEGGLIIYGIAERTGGYPKNVDDGAAPASISDQIEQIILHNINPHVEGAFAHPVALKSKGMGTFAFVVAIPKAQMNAPHQSDDKLYYRRRDATKLLMDDNEIRDMIGRSLEFGKKFGITWDLLIEMRRIVAAARERQQGQSISGGVPGEVLVIGVSPGLRSSGVAVMSLPKPLRMKAAELITAVDEYNSFVQVADGQRLLSGSSSLRSLLQTLVKNGEEICAGLEEVLKDQP
ncbi:AlbA family DNA-binding domain-containing protein [Bradyrhizobium genosp. A]|uniref:AlbA family DNA-binding domain-containing protein n=1 Tax=Bradyrhizobium genosp. A TaxID=83626 RepID=UPI003CF6415A